MSATGLILDAVLMLLLVAALGFGLRLERKLTALRAGQVAFAGAVTELNAAAGRAEAALASLRAAGQETDLLHDRIVKARTLKTELEALIARGPTPVRAAAAVVEPAPVAAPAPQPVAPAPALDGDAAARMAALRDRLAGARARPERDAAPIASLAEAIRAISANPVAKPGLNRPRRTQDEDLFAA